MNNYHYTTKKTCRIGKPANGEIGNENFSVGAIRCRRTVLSAPGSAVTELCVTSAPATTEVCRVSGQKEYAYKDGDAK